MSKEELPLLTQPIEQEHPSILHEQRDCLDLWLIISSNRGCGMTAKETNFPTCRHGPENIINDLSGLPVIISMQHALLFSLNMQQAHN